MNSLPLATYSLQKHKKTLKSIGSEHSIKEKEGSPSAQGSGAVGGNGAAASSRQPSPPRGFSPPKRTQTDDLLDAYSSALQKNRRQLQHLQDVQRSSEKELEQERRASRPKAFQPPSRSNTDELLAMYDKARNINDTKLNYLESNEAQKNARKRGSETKRLKATYSAEDLFLPWSEADTDGQVEKHDKTLQLNAESLAMLEAQDNRKENGGGGGGGGGGYDDEDAGRRQSIQRSDSDRLYRLYEASMQNNTNMIGSISKKEISLRKLSVDMGRRLSDPFFTPNTAVARLSPARADSKKRIAAKCVAEADLAARGTSILRASVNSSRGSARKRMEELAGDFESRKNHRRSLSTRGLQLFQEHSR